MQTPAVPVEEPNATIGLKRPSSRPNSVIVLGVTLALAFGLRLGSRVASGEASFWANGYSAYYEMALNFLAGGGLCIDRLGPKCAYWPPVYPLFLAATALVGHSYLLIVVPQAAVGAATAWCSFLLGTALFNRATGLLASLLTAFYPYYVIHDTALQETSIFTLLTALAMVFLLKTSRTGSRLDATAAGLFLGLATLTRASLAPYCLLAFMWIACFGSSTALLRRRNLAVAFLPFSMLLGCWLLRTDIVIGAPTLTSQSGRFLWIGNNPLTFSHYPTESIDLSENEAWKALSEPEWNKVVSLSDNEVGQSAWFAQQGLAFIRTHPLLTAQTGLRKLVVAFSCTLSPSRDAVVQSFYGLAYCPILLLALLGMWLSRRDWRTLAPIYLLFVAFAVTTAMFWAHTSHRSYLDVYLQVFAAYSLSSLAAPMLRSLAVLRTAVHRPL